MLTLDVCGLIGFYGPSEFVAFVPENFSATPAFSQDWVL